MFAPLMPAEVLGSGTGSLSQIGQETIKSGGGTRASSATTSKKPIRKRPVGEGKSTSKKRARSESDIDKGDNLHPRPKMSYAQLAALALRSDEKNEASVSFYKIISVKTSLPFCFSVMCEALDHGGPLIVTTRLQPHSNFYRLRSLWVDRTEKYPADIAFEHSGPHLSEEKGRPD